MPRNELSVAACNILAVFGALVLLAVFALVMKTVWDLTYPYAYDVAVVFSNYITNKPVDYACEETCVTVFEHDGGVSKRCVNQFNELFGMLYLLFWMIVIIIAVGGCSTCK